MTINMILPHLSINMTGCWPPESHKLDNPIIATMTHYKPREKKIMTFVNEYIPADDFKKYDFETLNNRTKETSGTGPSDFWTIDRSADIWLREFYTESDHTAVRGGFTGMSVWDYSWKGTLLLVKIKDIETGGGIGKHCWARRKLLAINIPAELESQRLQILKDLEAAFVAYKDGGVLSEATSFSFTLDI